MAPISKKAQVNTAASTASSIEVAKLQLDKSNKSTADATEALKKVMETAADSIGTLSAQLVTLNDEIFEKSILLKTETAALLEERQNEIAKLEAEYADKEAALIARKKSFETDLAEFERTQKLDFNLRMKEDEQNVMRSLITKFGFAELSAADHKNLKDALEACNSRLTFLETKGKEETVKAVKEAVDANARILQLEFKATEAGLKSQAESLSAQLKAAQADAARLEKQLDETRKAMVDISANNSKPSVTISTQNPTGK